MFADYSHLNAWAELIVVQLAVTVFPIVQCVSHRFCVKLKRLAGVRENVPRENGQNCWPSMNVHFSIFHYSKLIYGSIYVKKWMYTIEIVVKVTFELVWHVWYGFRFSNLIGCFWCSMKRIILCRSHSFYLSPVSLVSSNTKTLKAWTM